MTTLAKKPAFLLGVVALLAVSALLFSCAAKIEEQEVVTIETANGPVVFHVELALKPEDQARGLMHRTSLPEDAGMLFVFANEARRDFWMKDTLIPLDMLFIARDGTIHHIHRMAKPLDHTLATSERPVKAVLEINGGLSDVLGIAVGDKIIHPAFRNQLPQ